MPWKWRAAKIALGALGDEQQGDAIAIEKVADAISKNSGVAKEAVQTIICWQNGWCATGLLARTKGATINPNLELLFNGPH